MAYRTQSVHIPSMPPEQVGGISLSRGSLDIGITSSVLAAGTEVAVFTCAAWSNKLVCVMMIILIMIVIIVILTIMMVNDINYNTIKK